MACTVDKVVADHGRISGEGGWARHVSENVTRTRNRTSLVFEYTGFRSHDVSKMIGSGWRQSKLPILTFQST